MSVKEGDFVEIRYTGKVENQIFDTTDLETAKKLNIYNENMHYGSVRIRVGDGLLLKGLDEDLLGKETNKKYQVKIQPEKAFGKKSPEMIRMIPKSKFTQSGLTPQNGMTVNIDGVMATIKTVSGGRVLVDFNHPLSGKEVDYEYEVTKIITEDKEKVESIIAMEAGLKPEQYSLELKEKKATLDLKNKELDPIKEPLKQKIKEATGIEVEFK